MWVTLPDYSPSLRKVKAETLWRNAARWFTLCLTGTHAHLTSFYKPGPHAYRTELPRVGWTFLYESRIKQSFEDMLTEQLDTNQLSLTFQVNVGCTKLTVNANKDKGTTLPLVSIFFPNRSVSRDLWQTGWCCPRGQERNPGAFCEWWQGNNPRWETMAGYKPLSGDWEAHHCFRRSRGKWESADYLPASSLSACSGIWIRLFVHVCVSANFCVAANYY